MKLHSRHKICRDAECDFLEAYCDWSRKYMDLTHFEVLRILQNVQDTQIKHGIRAERHPEDPDAPADIE